MNSRLKELIKKYRVEVNFIPLERNGYLLRGKNGKPNLVFVNSKLSEKEAKEVIIHELGHLKHDHELAKSYKDNYKSRICSEHGANGFLIHERVKEYVDLGYDAMTANYVDLAKGIGVTDFSRVKYELSKYLIK